MTTPPSAPSFVVVFREPIFRDAERVSVEEAMNLMVETLDARRPDFDLVFAVVTNPDTEAVAVHPLAGELDEDNKQTPLPEGTDAQRQMILDAIADCRLAGEPRKLS